MKKAELFWDSSSTDSECWPPEDSEKNTKKPGFKPAPVKIEEILAFSDSDSENYKEIGVTDLTYEEFIERKQALSNEKQEKSNKKDLITAKIKELQNEWSFQEANTKSKKTEEKMFRSSEGKIKGKYEEITKEKGPLMVKKHSNKTYFQELEELKQNNRNLREKLRENGNKENKEGKNIKEEAILGKIHSLKMQVNGLIAQKKEKIRGKIVTTKKKPMNFMKETHCQNCAKLLCKGIPTRFCPVHENYHKPENGNRKIV